MRLRLRFVLCCLLVACGPPADTDEVDAAPADTVSQAARDSAIARSRLPGAPAVGKALDVSETARERAATLDSIR